MDLRRKAYENLLQWKARPHKPLIVKGLRQVGKSYLVDKFTREHYEKVALFDFRHNDEIRSVFNGNLDVDTIIKNATVYFPAGTFVPGKTVLVFEEITDCSRARTSLKSFAADGRYDVICTGSLLGVENFRHKTTEKIPSGNEEFLEMKPLDFEEFLWANGVDASAIEVVRQQTRAKKELPASFAIYFQEMIRRYMVVGGLPEVVDSFVTHGFDYASAREVLNRLLFDYRNDFGRFVNENGEEEVDYVLQAKLNRVFDSIPRQLARENGNMKFKYADILKGARASSYDEAFIWLEKAGLVKRCYNLKALETPLLANVDEGAFKAFIADMGILMALFPLSTTQLFLQGKLDSRKGALYENLAAVLLSHAGISLTYYGKSEEHLEIDFVMESEEGIVLIEEKSTNSKMAASRAVMEGKTPYHASACYKIIPTNFGRGDFFTAIPQYCLPFLLEEFKDPAELKANSVSL